MKYKYIFTKINFDPHPNLLTDIFFLLPAKFHQHMYIRGLFYGKKLNFRKVLFLRKKKLHPNSSLAYKYSLLDGQWQCCKNTTNFACPKTSSHSLKFKGTDLKSLKINFWPFKIFIFSPIWKKKKQLKAAIFDPKIS